MKDILVEGIEFNEKDNSFVFNFSVDSEKSIIKLNEQIYQIKEYLPYTYFGYTFDESIEKKLKPIFIDALKFPNRNGHAKIEKDDLNKFINKSISRLNDKINLAKYDCIVYPESRSKLNDLVLEKITRYSFSSKYQTFKIVKNLPQNIEFDYDRYFAVRNTAEKDKENAGKSIQRFMEKIHFQDYVSLGKDIQPKYRKYLRNFFSFKNKEDLEAFKDLNDEKKILVIDDIATTGSAIEYVLNAIRTVNNFRDSQISVFCILGNKI